MKKMEKISDSKFQKLGDEQLKSVCGGRAECVWTSSTSCTDLCQSGTWVKDTEGMWDTVAGTTPCL